MPPAQGEEKKKKRRQKASTIKERPRTQCSASKPMPSRNPMRLSARKPRREGKPMPRLANRLRGREASRLCGRWGRCNIRPFVTATVRQVPHVTWQDQTEAVG